MQDENQNLQLGGDGAAAQAESENAVSEGGLFEKVIELHKEGKQNRFDWSGIINSGWNGLTRKEIENVRQNMTDAGIIVDDSANDNYWTKLAE
jgi:hypothetical protein